MEQQMKLIKKAKRGDTHAFAQLYSEVYQELYKAALYTLKNSHDAEDTVSDTVADAWAQIGSLRKEESFRSWIFAILSNKCRRKMKEYVEKTVELPEDLCSNSQDTEESLDVRASFAKLDDEERLILSLNIFGGYSSREIGKALQMNDNTVRSRQKRALEKMRAQLIQ
ncbi:MAG: sigma-70 family RNA polymerase sigma factor [Eubacteriales bacterium]|nr:sigma-70 family RNA polymerase sigma factor [Eubacteriales bacterium]